VSDTDVKKPVRETEAPEPEAPKVETSKDVEPNETDEQPVEAAMVAPGASYPEPTVQRIQSVTSASGLNQGSVVVDHEESARATERPARDGVQILDGQKVYVKTFRLGVPPGSSLPPELHEANMRQTVEDTLKAGERVQSRTMIHSIDDDELNHQMLVTYYVELVLYD
jgi:hypothetical protein